MPKTPVKYNSSQPLIEPDGTPSQVFRTYLLQVSNELQHVGTGSPEGVLEAPQYSTYIDETAPLTPVMYKKMLPEVGGDRRKGWATI